MNTLLVALWVAATSRVHDLRQRHNENGLTSVEGAVVTGLVVTMAVAIVAIIRVTGESAANDVKYK